MATVADPPARRFRVDGMDCAGCARTVEKGVLALDGVAGAEVSFGSGTLVVRGDVAPETVTAAVGRAGYRARPADVAAADRSRMAMLREPRLLSTVVSVVVLLAGVVASLASAPGAARPLYLASIAIGGWPIARAAAGALRRGSLDMNVLMALAALGAVGIGEHAEGAWVLVLFAVGTSLEAMALDRSRRSVRSLMQLAPARARVLGEDGAERLVDVEHVEAGTLFTVRPGERVALDGEVTGGVSSVDQSPITGESVPVDRQSGDAVFAGTLNVHGALTVRATRVAAASTLSRVAQLVEEAQGSRAPAERFVDRFARVYTPLVVGGAAALVVVPVLLGGDLDTWLYRALALLIVACPCSLVISVPVAVVSAVGGAARRGILVKGGQALEDLGRVRTVALDKTGTLTLGLPRVEDVRVLGGMDDREALGLVAAVEASSEHPLAAALRREARERGVPVAPATAFRALPGRGAEAVVGGRSLWAGGPRLVAERSGAAPRELVDLEERGQTAIALGEADRVLAVFGIADQPREDATGLVAALRAAGVERTVMLTGDAEPVARAIAARAGVDEVRAGLLPEDKLVAVRELEAQAPTAMVGDGINDAPALAAARVGVAMGAAGSDAALQAADVALMGDRLDRLPEAIGLSRRALRIMRANVVASLVVKGVFVLLAPFGLVTLVVAVAADMGMSLLVTGNALRLLRAERPGSPADGRPEGEARATAPAPCDDGCCAPAAETPSPVLLELPMAGPRADG